MKIINFLIISAFINMLSFNTYSQTEFKGAAGKTAELSSQKLQNIYAEIYKIKSDQKEYYHELREKSISENFRYLYNLKIINSSEFNDVIADRKRHLFSCSGIVDKNFCLYKLSLKKQNDVIGDIVERGGSVNEAINKLAPSEESDYQLLKKYKNI